MRELVGQGKPFYSSLDKAAGLLRRKVGTGSEFLKELMSIPGVKQAEIAERGLGELLNAPKMTHEQFMAALGEKPAPAIHEKVLGEKPTLPSKEILRRNANDLIRVRAREYASEGADTSAEYRTMAAEEMQRLRTNHMDQALRLAEERATENPSSTYHGGYTLPGGENYREMLIKAPKGVDQFPGVPSHFNGEPNILASMRLKDRTAPGDMGYTLVNKKSGNKSQHYNTIEEAQAALQGMPESMRPSLDIKPSRGPEKKLLHLEELQSDWHQQGRERGYKERPFTKQDEKRFKNLYENRYKLTPEEIQEFNTLNASRDAHYEGVPNAPFKKNWEEMALKRLIHHAAENGYHGIVVTPGQEQAKRYSIGNEIGQLNADEYDIAGDRQWRINAKDKLGNKVPISSQYLTDEELASHVGKELANKIINDRGGEYSGLDLHVGGEGMKSFYDKKVPNILNSIGKKYGVKTELHAHPIETGREEMVPDNAGLGQIRSGKPEYAQAHHFPITEEMRQDVKKNGIPLYESGGSVSTQ